MTKPYQAAFSQIDITPGFQVELIGCERDDSRSQGVLHPLYAQTLLFRYGGDTYCLITIDNLGLTTQLANDLRTKIAQQLDSQVQHVMLCFSHTHSAPCPAPFALNGELYFDFMCQQIEKCVENAEQELFPCRAGWALTSTDIGENRRDGCSIVDNRLGALKIINSENGEPIVVVLRITAHANVLMRNNHKISSDFFGLAREQLQTYFACPVMLVQGAAGNIKPVGVDKVVGGNVSDLEIVSERLLSSATRLSFEMQDIDEIRMFSKEITYFSDVPSKDLAAKIAADARETCGIDGADWLLKCERLRQTGVEAQSQKGEVQFFKINNGCLCGVAEEIFCELSLEAQIKTGNPLFLLNGYTNGCAGYLPDEKEWKKGGYEILYSYLQYYPFHGHVMPYREDTAAQIVNLVTEEWDRLIQSG